VTSENLKDIIAKGESSIGTSVTLEGWIRNHRRQKTFGFIDFFDGTCMEALQVVYDEKLADFDKINTYHVGASVRITGVLAESGGKQKGIELQAEKIELIGSCPEEYPLQPKRHSLEFLREIAYLRPRTRLFQAVFRIRSLASFAIHKYFHENGYVYVHTPLITGNDAEGAGNTFTVTSLDSINPKTDFSEDFFGRHTSLAVTGQLEAETFALAFKKVYTFGPTFRADFLKYIVSYILENAASELDFLERFTKSGLIDKLTALTESHIARVSYTDAIDILKNADAKFEFEPHFGADLAKEHEKYLTDEHFGSPVFVYNWPKDIKAFYMYQNEDDTVRAVDLLVPGAGELMGGSQREASYERLFTRMNDMGISTEEMYWYLNLRKFGGCDHAGFGMGFERLLIYLTGVENIRDVIPYPRTPQNCEF
jgi:asparaginyl-tRNA synthetase